MARTEPPLCAKCGKRIEDEYLECPITKECFHLDCALDHVKGCDSFHRKKEVRIYHWREEGEDEDEGKPILTRKVERHVEKNARPLIKAIKSGKFMERELRQLLDFEKENKERKTVVTAIQRLLSQLSSTEVSDYFRMNARPIIKAVKNGKFTEEGLKLLLDFEKENKKRSTVIDAIESKLKELSGTKAPEYFNLNARPIKKAVRGGEMKRRGLKLLLEFEKENKNRKTVIKAIKSKLESWKR